MVKKSKKKWSDEFYYDIGEWCKRGYNNKEIAQLLGVTHHTMQAWISHKPALKAIIKKTRRPKSNPHNFREFVYQQLPPNLQKLWNKISFWHDEPDALTRVESILENAGTDARKHLFMYALTAGCNFNVSAACKMCNVTVAKFKGWLRDDPHFAELIDEIQYHQNNFFEGKLVELIQAGDPSAILFAARTRLKERGYGEKSTIEVTGNVNHTHSHILSMESLDLPLDMRKTILEQARKQSPELLTLDATAMKTKAKETA